jgi:hypothetical protein
MTLARFYTYREMLVVPNVVQAEEGFYFDEAPVTVYDTDKPEFVREIIGDLLDKDNDVVPTPERSTEHFPGSPILEVLSLKRWLKFEGEASMYSVYTNDNSFEYYASGNALEGTWRPDRMKHLTFERASGRDALLDEILRDLFADIKARKAPERPPGGGLMLWKPPDQS